MNQKNKNTIAEFEQNKIHVKEQTKTAVHGAKPPQPASGRGNVFFIGPRLSGKTFLGQKVAERLTRPFHDALDWQKLAELVKQGGQVATVSAELLEQEGVANLLHRGGKVFYLMVDAATLAQRAEVEMQQDQLALREQLFAELQAQEPLCMRTLHYILQAVKPAEELVEDVLEKLQITGDA